MRLPFACQLASWSESKALEQCLHAHQGRGGRARWKCYAERQRTTARRGQTRAEFAAAKRESPQGSPPSICTAAVDAHHDMSLKWLDSMQLPLSGAVETATPLEKNSSWPTIHHPTFDPLEGGAPVGLSRYCLKLHVGGGGGGGGAAGGGGGAITNGVVDAFLIISTSACSLCSFVPSSAASSCRIASISARMSAMAGPAPIHGQEEFTCATPSIWTVSMLHPSSWIRAACDATRSAARSALLRLQ